MFSLHRIILTFYNARAIFKRRLRTKTKTPINLNNLFLTTVLTARR